MKLQLLRLQINLFFVLTLTGIFNDVSAKHMGLSSLTYTHVSGNLYHFKFIYYRDCFGIIPQQIVPMTMSSYNCGLNQVVGLSISNQGELITPVCPNVNTTCNGGTERGIQKWTYEADVSIPAQCSDWSFSVSYPRNPYFTNVQTPYYDSYAEARLDNSVYDNSSPIISNEAIMIVCMDQDFHFNNGFIDPDGDSITIAMVSPMMTANSPMIYKEGFYAWSPVTSDPPVSFDANTGDLFMHPILPEISMMSFQVNEFRNGNIIGRFTRDIGIYTVRCDDGAPKLSGVNGSQDFFISATPGTACSFQVFSNDLDVSDSLGLSWNNSISGATFISDSTKHPAGTFSWTPSPSDVRTGPYIFTATVRDNWCPMNNIQTYTYSIYVSVDSAFIALNTKQPTRSEGSLIYPNPTSGTMHFDSYNKISEIRVYDHTGKIILTDKLHSSVYSIDEPAGVYLVEQLFDDGRSLKQTIIKK